MTRITSMLLLGVLLLAPALCLGGLLEHDCDCGGEVDLECQHEDSCSADPCSDMLLRGERSVRALLQFDASWALPSVLPWQVEGDLPARSWSATRLLFPRAGSHLPYLPSDRPLLI